MPKLARRTIGPAYFMVGVFYVALAWAPSMGEPGMGDAPRSGSFIAAMAKGVVFGAVFVLLL